MTMPYFYANFADNELFPVNLAPLKLILRGICRGTFSTLGAVLSGYVLEIKLATLSIKTRFLGYSA
jgi:hypothetical protein